MVRLVCIILSLFSLLARWEQEVQVTAPAVESPVRALLARVEVLRSSALGGEHTQFESWQVISLSQAHQPSELRRLGFSWVAFMSGAPGQPPKLRAQFMDARQVVEVVFSARLLFDSEQVHSERHYLVGQDGSVLNPAQSLSAVEQGCDVVSAATRYLLSGNQRTRSGVFRSCEGAKIAATFLRIGGLPFAWVSEAPLSQPAQEEVVGVQPQSEVGAGTSHLRVASLVLIFALSALIALAQRYRTSRARTLSESIERYAAAFRQSRMARTQLISTEEHLEQMDPPRYASPRFAHLRSAEGAQSQAQALVHDFGFHLARFTRKSTPPNVAFFLYQPQTLEFDWSAALGHWGVPKDAKDAPDSGFAISSELFEEMRRRHSMNEIPSLESYPPLEQWWMERMGDVRDSLSAWVIWPPNAAFPAGALVLRGIRLKPAQEPELVLCLREAANAWKTGVGEGVSQPTPSPTR